MWSQTTPQRRFKEIQAPELELQAGRSTNSLSKYFTSPPWKDPQCWEGVPSERPSLPSLPGNHYSRYPSSDPSQGTMQAKHSRKLATPINPSPKLHPCRWHAVICDRPFHDPQKFIAPSLLKLTISAYLRAQLHVPALPFPWLSFPSRAQSQTQHCIVSTLSPPDANLEAPTQSRVLHHHAMEGLCQHGGCVGHDRLLSCLALKAGVSRPRLNWTQKACGSGKPHLPPCPVSIRLGRHQPWPHAG